jgi:hypothetical protein
MWSGRLARQFRPVQEAFKTKASAASNFPDKLLNQLCAAGF